MSGLSVITCTGGRPEAFALLEGWISRQSYTGDIQWIVIDDCDPPTVPLFGQEVIRPVPSWKPGQITLGRNLTCALDYVKYDKIVFCEDDEAYLPDYLKLMDQMLDTADLAGEIPARYYNVRQRMFRVLDNRNHASLCQTGMRSDLIPRLRYLCTSQSPFIDMRLWEPIPDVRYLLVPTAQVVSIKGLPGRPGIGIGHRPHGDWKKDPVLAQLRAWIGADADLYVNFTNEVLV